MQEQIIILTKCVTFFKCYNKNDKKKTGIELLTRNMYLLK